jgi:hypothetical protein
LGKIDANGNLWLVSDCFVSCPVKNFQINDFCKSFKELLHVYNQVTVIVSVWETSMKAAHVPELQTF